MSWHGYNTTDAVGWSAFLTSRLIQLENVATPEKRDEFAEAMSKIPFGQFHLVVGKGVRENDPDSTETSVTPAWRSTVTHIDGGAYPLAVTPEAFTQAFGEANTMYDPLREITPNSGAYWNEADRFEPRWEESFWGLENYAKLKQIKLKYDPEGMFRVWNGIGGTRPETEY